MPSMLEMIRNSQVPSNLMQSASRGALSVPPGEMIEILVHLAIHNKLFSERARLTLAGWDEKASVAAAADPQTSAEVLGYLIAPENLRTCLLPALAENPSVSEELLDKIAVSGSRSAVETLLGSVRVMKSPRLLQGLQSNPNLRPVELAEIAKKVATFEIVADAQGDSTEPPDEVVEVAIVKFLEENAAELAAEKDKVFQPIALTHDEIAEVAAACRLRRSSRKRQRSMWLWPRRSRQRKRRNPKGRRRRSPSLGLLRTGAIAPCRKLPS